jgi:hypothetical protein
VIILKNNKNNRIMKVCYKCYVNFKEYIANNDLTNKIDFEETTELDIITDIHGNPKMKSNVCNNLCGFSVSPLSGLIRNAFFLS